MRRILFLYLISILAISATAQNRPVTDPMRPLDGFEENGYQMDPNMRPENPDSLNNVEVISLPPKLYMWNVSEELGTIKPVPVDTMSHQFQNTNLVEGMNGNYNYLGNLGAPRHNRIFFDIPETSINIFLDPYSFFLWKPSQLNFTNSNVPYTNLTYYKAGNKVDGEERFKAYFSVNANKRLAFGFNIDYLYGRGFYRSQSTSFFNGSLFGSYRGDRYQAHAIFSSNNLKMVENGGITDDRYITDPLEMAEGSREYEPANIPTRLSNTWNRNKQLFGFLTHRYSLGFHRDVPDLENDTILTEYVPVTSFIHTLKIESGKHQFESLNEPEDYYENTYINWSGTNTNDSTSYWSVKNTFGIALLEGFNKYAKAGLTAYASHRMTQYSLMDRDSVSTNKFTEHELYVGGELSKRSGNTLHYAVIGEVGAAGKAIGQFRVKGDLDLNFRLWNDTVSLIARGYISNTLPSFYKRRYISNHFIWDNDNFDKEFRTKVEGELNIERWKTNLRAGVENIKNYTHFNQRALPEQHGGNIQVLTAQLNQNFKLGIFHLDNEVTWQKSSNSTVLPLPALSLYHNFYISAKLAKRVLSLELGADVRYFTKYKALAYTPAVQQFHLQPENDQVDIGAYPIINVYANFHLKRTRFFVMMYHVNQGMGNSNYFLVPHYPINQRLLKFGLSWNFYD